MSSRSRAIRTTRAPSLRLRRPQRVIRHIAPSSRGVPLPVTGIALPGRTTQVFPSRSSRRPTALLGFLAPFAGLIPPPGGHATLASRAARLAGTHRVLRALRRHFCRSGPTCRSCLPHPPRLIFVGVTDRLLDNTICKSDRPGMGWLRLLGFDSRLRSASPAHVRPERRVLPWALPLAGLSGTSPCIGRARPRLPITSLRNIHAPLVADARSFLSAHGLGRRSFPSRADIRWRKLLRRRADRCVTAKD
jgi:hypothetical protein